MTMNELANKMAEKLGVRFEVYTTLAELRDTVVKNLEYRQAFNPFDFIPKPDFSPIQKGLKPGYTVKPTHATIEGGEGMTAVDSNMGIRLTIWGAIMNPQGKELEAYYRLGWVYPRAMVSVL